MVLAVPWLVTVSANIMFLLSKQEHRLCVLTIYQASTGSAESSNHNMAVISKSLTTYMEPEALSLALGASSFMHST